MNVVGVGTARICTTQPISELTFSTVDSVMVKNTLFTSIHLEPLILQGVRLRDKGVSDFSPRGSSLSSHLLTFSVRC